MHSTNETRGEDGSYMKSLHRKVCLCQLKIWAAVQSAVTRPILVAIHMENSMQDEYLVVIS